MSFPQRTSANPESASDRRRNSRIPLSREVRYRLLRSVSRSVQGNGRTLNFSCAGILFTAESDLPIGQPIEVAVNWPPREEGVCALQLVAIGRVVRSGSGRAAVRIETHEFRTSRHFAVAAGAAVSSAAEL